MRQLKKRLMNPPILRWPDSSRPFELHVDASGVGMGAVLIQKGDEGEERIIAYASATFTKEEIKWDVRERECYAAIKFTEYFRPYLVD